jgi:FtsH-binding integral membrane protein
VKFDLQTKQGSQQDPNQGPNQGQGRWERVEARTDTLSQTGSFATKVYGWMTTGLLLTAFVSYAIFHSGLFMALLPFWWVPTLGTFALAMVLNRAVDRLSFPALAGCFLLYGALQGVLFGTILPLYAAAYGGDLIWTTFLTAGLIYGLAMCYGIFTKTDLTRFSKILQMALFALVGISLVYLVLSFFTQISWMMLAISYLGLVLFVGLTAYDAQQIRRISHQVDGNSLVGAKLSLMVALKMYLNVIMIFWYLLQIFSSSRRN